MKRLIKPLLAALAVFAVLFAAGFLPPRKAHAAAGGFPGFATTVMTLPAATAVMCPPIPMTDRIGMSIYNGDSATVYVGPDNTVDANTGFPILPGSLQAYDVTYQLQPVAGQLWCFSSAGTSARAVRILEIR